MSRPGGESRGPSKDGLEELPLFSSLFAQEPKAPEPKLEPARAPTPPVAVEPPRRLTVTELTQKIRGILEPSFTEVLVQGEVSNYRPAASGHAYFSLKDSGASISAAIFGWGKRSRTFELKDGLQVFCRGKVSVYPPRGSYQLTVEQIEPLGAGALQIAFEQLKARLSAEGLFEPSRKRRLPAFPSRIAVVTSPSGAAIQDMLNILKRRAPHLRVTVVPAIVQGDTAAAQIIRGLELANRHGLGDLVVLARGGGSIEDLWCFNDEALARAIAASKLPVISAVGHEIDFTISDFVSDLRAPTPSAAAEIVSGQWVDAIGRIRDARSRLAAAVARDITTRRQLLGHVSARLVSPRDRLREQAQRCDELHARLGRAMETRLERRRASLGQLVAKLDALSPLRVLERGYAITRDADDGSVVRSASQVVKGKTLEITFHDGKAPVRAL
ncbi:MAG TPA: exodeoxyribonuclease VII large subunit [Bdellovibrionota bacterium]|nr:exodeoxyribonuclease VII large subunit [Bdellovibrionota bacterium]